MSSRRFGERLMTAGIATGLAVLMMGAGRRVPDPIAGKGGGPQGKSGSLDASFAGDGTLMTFIPPILEEPQYNTDLAYAVAIDSRGGLLVAGVRTPQEFALQRFNADGTLDTTFGTDGLATFPSQGNVHDVCMVLQPDGRILVGGDPAGPSNLARFMPDGSLDANFGQGGVVDMADPRAGGVTEMALLPDGRIVHAGGSTLHLTRRESNGLPDNTFGINGVVDTGVSLAGPFDMARQTDGRLIVAYYYGHTKVVRFEEDGSPDAGFGSGGVVDLPFISFEPAIVVQPDGKIAVGGASFREVNPAPNLELVDFQIARLHPDGSPDEGFGTDGTGIVTTHFHGARSEIRALALDAQGRLVAAGSAVKNGGATNFALARYLPDGTLDKSFGRNGTTTVDVDNLHQDDTVRAMTLQPDGRLVVVGWVAFDRGLLDEFAWGLARFLP